MLRYRNLTGQQIAGDMDALARLRIRVFADYPYLYDGDLDYERRYLQPYIDSDSALVVAAYDGDTLVGAATGTAMEDHADEFAAALDIAGVAAEDTFYCAESVLLHAYRGQGAGHHFFDAREAHARALGRRICVFCSVIREPDHPQRPVDYRPLDGFWKKRGYQPVEGALAYYTWRDLGHTDDTQKPLQLWLKHL